jgi:carboxyl-terminal processing protease
MRRKFILIIILVPTIFLSSSKRDEDYFEISKNLRIVGSVYEKINNYYVDEVKPGELMKKGIDAMLQSLDPFTVYISEAQIEDFRFTTTGEYGGIGAIIKKSKENVIITELYENSPAFNAGLKPGDQIIEIDNQSLKKASIQDVSNFLKGPSESIIELKVLRNSLIKSIMVTRKEIKLPSVPIHKKINSNTGYIKLTSFTQTAASETKQALLDLKKNNVTNLILDLRSNGGGLLNEAVKIVNFFTPKGQLVVNTKSRIPEMNRAYYTTLNPIDTNLNLVVLIDENSASASEIVAGSLQDLDKAVILGTNSYGKGLVQQTKELSFGSQIKLTVAKYYTPSGRCIQKIDYSKKSKKGKSEEIADSLVNTFYTRAGRKVMDARGIEPDCTVTMEYYSAITEELLFNDVIFEYVNKAYGEVDSIDPPYTFKINEQEYNKFKSFALAKDITYQTQTNYHLKELKKVAEKEKYFEENTKLFNQLDKVFSINVENDLNKFSDEITFFIENEIVSRYYFQKGRIEASLVKDPYMIEAQNILAKDSLYSAILGF